MIDLSALGLDPIDLQALIPGVDVRWVFFVGVFVGILLIWEAIRQQLSRTEDAHDARSRRMKLLGRGVSSEEVLELLKPSEPSGPFTRVPVFGDLSNELKHAGIAMAPAVVVLGTVLLAALVAALLSLKLPLLFAVPGGVIAAPVVVGFLIRNATARRKNRLVAQLPDALELMSRGLRVGHPINATVMSVADEMPDPIGSEFGIIVDQVSFGQSLTDAFTDFEKRVDLEDVHYLATSVRIQHGTGGNLAEILATLSRVIRDRMIMRQKIRSISSEARMSAILLSAIPVFIFVFMQVALPSYFGDVSDDPLYRPMLIMIVVFIVSNALVLRKLVNFKF